MRDTIWVPVVAVLGPLVGSAIGVLLPSRESLLRRLLAFAAGAMLYVTAEELLPQAQGGGAPAYLTGFLLMMLMDTALG